MLLSLSSSSSQSHRLSLYVRSCLAPKIVFFLLLLPSSPVPNFLAPKFTSLCFSHCAICPCLGSGLKLRRSSFPVPLSYWPLLCHWLNSFWWLDHLCKNLDNFFWLLPSLCLLWKGFLSSCLCQQHCLNETGVATEGVVLVFWGHRSLCESEEIYRPSQKKKNAQDKYKPSIFHETFFLKSTQRSQLTVSDLEGYVLVCHCAAPHSQPWRV